MSYAPRKPSRARALPDLRYPPGQAPEPAGDWHREAQAVREDRRRKGYGAAPALQPIGRFLRPAMSWGGYAPREPHRLLLELFMRLAGANRSDATVVSIAKLRALLMEWHGFKRSLRWVSYHIAAAVRDHLVIRQSRWVRRSDGTIRHGRSRYRVAWRLLRRLGYAARHFGRLAALVVNPARRQTVQKSAQGILVLLNSLLPAVP